MPLIDRHAVVMRVGDLPTDLPPGEPVASQADTETAVRSAGYFKRWANERCRLPDVTEQEAFDLWNSIREMVVSIHAASRLAGLPTAEVERLIRVEHPGQLGERAIAAWRWATGRTPADALARLRSS